MHQANDGHNYAFFLVDRFQDTNILNPTLECPIYKIRSEETQLLCIFPINYVNHTPQVHFVHACTNTCNDEHDETNNCYIFNKYYYNTV